MHSLESSHCKSSTMAHQLDENNTDINLHVQCTQSRSLKARFLQCCVKLSRWFVFLLKFHPEHHHLMWTSPLVQITKSIEMTTMFLQAQHKKPILWSSHWVRMLQVSEQMASCKVHQLFRCPTQLDREQDQQQGTGLEKNNDN